MCLVVVQVGAEFWRCVSAQLAALGSRGASSLSALVHESRGAGGEALLRARCVRVDAEPKAARAAAAAEPLLAAAPAALGASGRGSNWAHGYRGPGEPGGGAPGCADDATLLKRALDAVRRELERCPSKPDVLLVHGLAGGTGGGLGCRMLEELRREHGAALFIVAAAVAPRAPGGDTSLLAPLATVMAIQFLQRYADAVFLFQNGELVSSLERAARQGGAPLPRIELADVNRAVGLRLAAVLLPSARDAPPAARDAVAQACPLPALRFAEVLCSAATHAAFETDAQGWASAAAALAAAAPKHDALDGNRVITSTSTLLLLRGIADGSAAVASGAAIGALSRAGVWPVVTWQPACAAFGARCTSRPLAAAGARCVAAVANRSSTIGPLSAAADGAARLLESGAYLHWFQRYDVSRDALQDGLEATRAVVAEYRTAHGHGDGDVR